MLANQRARAHASPVSLRMILRWSLPAALALAAIAQSPAPEPPSYFEFGKVVALGRDTVDIQTFDPQRQRLVQHSFAFTRESRADIVRVGDAVEVVFSPNASDWTLRRLIVLPAGIPAAGPPPRAETAAATPAPAPVARTPAVPKPQPTTLPRASTSKPAKKTARGNPAPLPAPAKVPKPAPPSATSLASTTRPASVPPVIPVALGNSSAEAAAIAARKPREIARDTPSEECNRSSADWPTQPLHIAVLDFRYPTEREESHDVGTTGGGSGTAVADLVFARLEQDEQTDDRVLWSRADRRRLDRSDFAGAARLGRQLGVDAVLAGTFVPMETPGFAPDDPFAPKTWDLRAGIVDTCTGQLLIQTSSVKCVGGLEPGLTTGADPSSCTHLSVTGKETADPKAHAGDFKAPLDAMLFPLEHVGVPSEAAAATGVVTGFTDKTVTVQLSPRAHIKAGDQLALHASRLAKNPTTYTLRNLQNEEIGRVDVQSVQGSTARGAYTGDYPPHPGDTAETVGIH